MEMDQKTIEFEFNYDIHNRKIDEVFNKILQWLTNEKAKIKDAQPPIRIIAVHGSHRTVSGWKRNAKKTIQLCLSDTDHSTHLRAVVRPAEVNRVDVASMEEEARANWNLLIEDMLSAIGDTTSKKRVDDILAHKRQIAPSELKKAKKMMTTGLIVAVLWFAITMVYIWLVRPDMMLPLAGGDDTLTYVLLPSVIAPSLILLYGLARYLTYRKSVD